MRNKKRNRIMLLLILLLGISIGFAALATTLKINGTASFSKNKWDIYWDNIGNISKSANTAVIDEASIDNDDNTSINFNVTLNEPGDFYEFQVDAVNAGSLDATVDVLKTVVNNDESFTLPSYVNCSVTYDDGSEVLENHLLIKKTNNIETRERFKVRLEFSTNITLEQLDEMSDDGDSYSFNINLVYKQANNNSILKSVSFEKDSWSTIAAIGGEAAKQTEVTDNKCGTYNIGDTKVIKMDIDGDGEEGEYVVRIANCSTPTVCKGEAFSKTACGFVVEFQDIIALHRMNKMNNSASVNGDGNKGGWKYSDMRAYLNGGIYLEGESEEIDYTGVGIIDALPSDLSSKIIDTKALSGYAYGDGGEGNFSTMDKLYLLDSREIYGTSYTNQNDTAREFERQLDYYQKEEVTTSNYAAALKKNSTGLGGNWFLRSASYNGSTRFFMVSSSGAWNNYEVWYAIGVSPAFRLG